MRLVLLAALLVSCFAVLTSAAAKRSLLAPAGEGPSIATLLDAPTPAPPKEEHFIQIRDGQFANGCNNFKLAGWNQWEVVEAAAGAPSLSGATIPVGLTGPQLVRTLLRRGAAIGFNTMRTWVHAVNPQYALQPKSGQFSEEAFQGLDYLLDEARRAGIKLILAFTSNWTPVGGLPEYMKWAGLTQRADFYTSPQAQKMYKDTVAAVINRRNTINGRLYKDDPTVMAWDLLNEPRCAKCVPGTVAKWYAGMAAYVKSLDSNHLVTTGEEGFYGCCKNPANPGQPANGGSEWAAEEGQNFIDDHSSPDIDFATIHSWPDNWGDVSEAFQRTWIRQHVMDAQKVLKKPVILEEWGKWVNQTASPPATMEDRTRFMSAAFDEVEELMTTPGSALQGSLFWQWYLTGQEGAPTEGGGRGLFGIYEGDEAFALIKENAQFVATLNTPIPGCQEAALKAAPVQAVDECKASWVGDTPGTGMEGPTCGIPINECVRGTAGCDKNAACVDTPSGFECRCHYGHTGDGRTCAPDAAALAALAAKYWTEPKGLSCKEGLPVEWPTHSPGWVYDPLRSFQFWNPGTGGKLGSKTNVTLQQCQIACEVAETCESFVYNDVLMQCFLSRGQCPIYNYCQGEEAKCVSTNDRGGSFSFGCGFWTSYYRLDSDAATNCAGFTPNPASVGTPNPVALQAFSDYQAKNPGPLRKTAPMLSPVAEPAPPVPPPAGAEAAAAGR